MYRVDILIPTARFVFSVEDGRVEVLPEHRSPEAFDEYRGLRGERAGRRHDDVPQHGAAARRRARSSSTPACRCRTSPSCARSRPAAWARPTSTSSCSRTRISITPAPAPISWRRSRCTSSRPGAHWTACGRPARAPAAAASHGRGRRARAGRGRGRARRGTATATSACASTTAAGPVVLCGDTIGPARAEFDAMRPRARPPPSCSASWQRIRAWKPAPVIAGHLPPFAP